MYEDYFSCHVTDSSFCLLYRNKDVDDGIVFSEFMLADGRSRRREIPITLPNRTFWCSDYTLWLKDALVLYTRDDFSVYTCIHMTLSGKYTWFDNEQARRIVKGKKIEEQ